MRRIAFLGAFGVCLAVAAPARASEHQMKVGEVLLSANGDTGIQYVELEDPGEPFPNAYALVVYDTDGGSVGSVTLNVPSGTKRLLVATAAAETEFSVTADETLTVTLPDPGQACFERTSSTPSIIHCLSWGNVNTPVDGSFGTDSGAAPADGLSLQRVAGNYAVATPTPGAANVGPESVDAGARRPDGGNAPGPDGGGSTGGPDAGQNAGQGDGGGGCGCRASRGGSGLELLLLALGALVLVRRRRNA